MAYHPRILIVDDESVHRRFASAVLSQAGWVVDEAADGEAARRAIAVRRYAVVLLDIGLPGADGFAVARAIRADAAGDPSVPILAFTASSAADLPARIAAAEMDGHLAKPIAAERLVDQVAAFSPLAPIAAQVRLVAAFGAAELATLNAHFRVQLDDALARIAGPDIAMHAHRIAGVAGTLGFAAVHDSWLALSEGVAGAAPRAASDARRALRILGPDAPPS